MSEIFSFTSDGFWLSCNQHAIGNGYPDGRFGALILQPALVQIAAFWRTNFIMPQNFRRRALHSRRQTWFALNV